MLRTSRVTAVETNAAAEQPFLTLNHNLNLFLNHRGGAGEIKIMKMIKIKKSPATFGRWTLDVERWTFSPFLPACYPQ
jgi:hypothetical protein